MDVIAFIKAYQLDIMLFMSGICATLVYMTTINGALSSRRKHVLILLETAAMLLLICDRFAYLYRGDVSTLGYWMVRICNFMVYLCTLTIPYSVSLYLCDLYTNEGKMKELPKRLTLCKVLFVVGVALLVISQFTGLYYTFDAQNQYQRAPGNLICYLMPMAMVFVLLSVIAQFRRLVTNRMSLALTLHLVTPLVASIIQLYTYGISLTNMAMVGMAIYLYMCALRDMNDSLKEARAKEKEAQAKEKEAQAKEISAYSEARRREHAMFEQTAEALASAIDAKDEYTHGHSSRVAMYSELIAREAGLPDEEVEKVYFSALLHDVGKIGVDDAIIRKEGRLTDEEFAQIKLHPVFGNQILSSIRESPYLAVGAHYHHERYDGRGYPEGLAGKDIPELARIIGVADAYDAMTSQRSYRDVRPQHLVREELLKGMGTQFDPRFARIMLHYMDLDYEYHMHQQLKGQSADLVEGLNSTYETELHCGELYQNCMTGVRILDSIAHISFTCTSDEGFAPQDALPSLVLFDSLDGMVHESGNMERSRRYFEYALIGIDGTTTCTEARKAQTSVVTLGTRSEGQQVGPQRYDIEAVRYYDHVQLRISDGATTTQVIVALPFSGRFSYLSLTGAHCSLSDITVERDDQRIVEDYIPRIIEEVSYIRGCPEGDIPNIQVEGTRARETAGIPIVGAMRLTFRAKALPNARLIWHCPYLNIFTSADGTVSGTGYQEFVLLRLDGEELVNNVLTESDDVATLTSAFEGWNAWLEGMKTGVDCEVVIRREGREVTVETENLGIAIRSVVEVPAGIDMVYVALTGDQCMMTDIHVVRGE